MLPLRLHDSARRLSPRTKVLRVALCSIAVQSSMRPHTLCHGLLRLVVCPSSDDSETVLSILVSAVFVVNICVVLALLNDFNQHVCYVRRTANVFASTVVYCIRRLNVAVSKVNFVNYSRVLSIRTRM